MHGLPITARAEPLLSAPYVWYESGFTARSVTVGDLNHDGHDDVAVADNYGSLAVFLGSGDGTLGPRAQFKTNGYAVSIAIAELTGDAHADLAVANGLNAVSILPGNGDGTFGSPTDFQTAALAYEVVSADLNNDGLSDLLVAAEEYPYFISVLRNIGGGGFAPHQDYPAFCQPASLNVGDVDRDGRPDVVATNNCNPGEISIWRGQGDGTLGPRTDIGVAPYPSSMRLADVTNDSYLDLVVVDSGISGSPAIEVFAGNGAGSFGSPIATPIDYNATSLAVGDFDRDGRLDAAVTHAAASPPPPPSISILRGNGDGTFSPPTRLATAPTPIGIALGHFSAGANLDLVTAHPNYSSSGIAIAHGNGDGSFGSQLRFAAPPNPLALATGDLDGDGHADLAAVTGDQLAVLRGDGHASFEPPTNYPANGFPYSVAIGMLNGDTLPDVAVTSIVANAVSVYLGVGGGILAPKVDYPTGSSPGAVVIGDVNLDGHQDLVCSNGGSGTVSVLLGNGSGFSPRRDFQVGNFPQRIALGDVDRDGRPDVVVGNFGGNTVSVLLGNGDGTFAANREFPAGSGAFGVALADLNEDGRMDIAASDFASNSAAVLMGYGDGTFAAPVIVTTGSAARDVVIMDFDADEHLDLAVANLLSSTVTILRGLGDGTFGPREDFGAGDEPATLSVSDFNEDGRPDVSVSAFQSGAIWVLLNQAGAGGCVDTGPPSLSVSLSPSTLWPPNHKLVAVHAAVEVHDDCDDAPQVSLVSITSDEPDQGADPDDLPDDIQGVDVGADLDFALRSERAGGGDGRTYRVCYEARDASGNVTSVCEDVVVPHDRRGRSTLAASSGARSLTIYGSETLAARDVAPASVMVGPSSLERIPVLHEPPQYGDLDHDGREDVSVAVSDRISASAAGEPLYARWEAGGWWYLAEIAPGLVTGVGPDAPLVFEASVSPNPGLWETTIAYALPRSGHVRLRIYDVAGHQVASLVESMQPAGRHRATFGPHVRSGIYLYQLEWTGGVASGKFAVLK